MKMMINAGKYIVRSDQYCTWLEEVLTNADGTSKKAKDGENKTKRVTGYCDTFESLLKDFLKKEIKGSDATTVKDALQAIASAEQKALSVIKEVNA